jgi:hypothetical protein
MLDVGQITSSDSYAATSGLYEHAVAVLQSGIALTVIVYEHA